MATDQSTADKSDVEEVGIPQSILARRDCSDLARNSRTQPTAITSQKETLPSPINLHQIPPSQPMLNLPPTTMISLSPSNVTAPEVLNRGYLI